MAKQRDSYAALRAYRSEGSGGSSSAKDSYSALASYRTPQKTQAEKDNEERRKRQEEIDKKKQEQKKPKSLADLGSIVKKGTGKAASFLFSGTEKALDAGNALTGGFDRQQKSLDRQLNEGKIDRKTYQEKIKAIQEDIAWAGTKSNTKERVKKSVGVGLEAATEIAPIGKATKGAKLKTKIIKGAKETAIMAGVGSVGSQLVENGKVDVKKTLADIAAGGVFGGGAAGAGHAASKALKATTNKIKPVHADEGILTTTPMSEAGKGRKVANALDSTKKAALDRFQPLRDYVKELSDGKSINKKDNAWELNKLRGGTEGQAKVHIEQNLGWIQDVDKQVVKDGDSYGYALQDLSQANKRTPEQLAKAQHTVDVLTQHYGGDLSVLEDYRAKMRTTFDSLLDVAEREGIVAPEHAKVLRDNPDYFAKMEVLQDELDKSSFANTSVNVKESRFKKLEGRSNNSQIAPAAESFFKLTQQMFGDVANNRVVKAVAQLGDEAGDSDIYKRLRSTTDVEVRQDKMKFLAETKPGKQAVESVVRKHAKQLRQLRAELDRLNREGMNLRLKDKTDKTMPNFVPSGMNGQVPTSKAGQVRGRKVKGERPDFLKESYEDPNKLVDDYADMLRGQESAVKGGQMVSNGDGGYKRISEHSKFYRDFYAENGRAPKAEDYRTQATKELESGRAAFGASEDYKQILTDNRTREAYKTLFDAKDEMARPAWESKLGPKDTSSFLSALVADDPARMKQIRKMIEAREPKMKALFDDVEDLRDELDGFNTARSQAFQEMREHADTALPKGYTRLSYMDNGVRNEIAVPKEIGDILTGADKMTYDVATNFMGKINSGFRQAVTTYNPLFTFLRNPIRDFKSFSTNSRFVPVHRALDKYASAMMDSLTNGKWSQEFLASGGGQAGYFAHEGGQAGKSITKSTEKLTNKRSIAGRVLTSPRDFMQKMSEAIEAAPRIAEYKAAREQGVNNLEAAIAGREVTVDFAQGGDATKFLNNWVPFLNARAQGTRRMMQAFQENPKRALTVWGATGVMPIAGLMAWNLSQGDTWHNIPDYEKENNFLFILPGSDNYIKFPKGDIDKILGNTLETSLSEFFGNGGNSGETLKKSLIGGLSNFSPVSFANNGEVSTGSVMSSILPPLIKAPVEAATNHSFFKDAPIVPENMKGAPVNEQFKENTSGLARLLGGALNQSPLKVENTVNNLAGNVPLDIANAATLDGSTGDRFQRAVVGNNVSKTENEFWKVYQPAKETKTYRERQIYSLIDEGSPDAEIKRAQRLADDYNRDIDKRFGDYFKSQGAYLSGEMSNGSDPIDLIDGLKIDIQINKKGKPYVKR